MDQTAKDQVLSEIAALEEQVENFTNELDGINSTEPFNPAQYNAIKAELDTANGKLEAKKAELSSIQNAETAAQEELSAQLESIDIGGETVSLRDLVPDEAAYQLLYIWLQQREMAKAQVMAAMKSSYESQIEGLEDGLAEISKLRQENYRLSDALADAEAKRDNAADQILERDKEITRAADQIQERDEEINRLKADNDNLRKQLEDSAKPKETTADAAAALERWKASRPAITDLRWKEDSRKTTYVATLVETGEQIEFGYLEKGKYREVTEEEASRFRDEQAAAANKAEPVQTSETNTVPDNSLVSDVLEPPVIDFPTVPVPAEPVPGTVVLSAEEITRRLLALEERVDQIAGA